MDAVMTAAAAAVAPARDARAKPRILLNASARELAGISGDVSFYRDLAAGAGDAADLRYVEGTPAWLRRPLGAMGRLGRMAIPAAGRSLAIALSRYRGVLASDVQDAQAVFSHLTYPWFIGKGEPPPVIWSSQGLSPAAYYDAIGAFRFGEVVGMYERFARKAALLQVWTRSCADLLACHCTFRTPVEVLAPIVPVPANIQPAPRTARVHFVFIGRQPGRKGLFDALVAYRRLLEAHDDVHFDVVTVLPRNVRDELEAVGDIEYHETIDEAEKWRLLARADVLVLPTYAETFGYVLCEAMAYGCALVTSDYAPLNEIVEDGVNGFVVEPGNVPALHAALERLVSSDALLAVMKDRSRRMYRARYSAQALVPRYLEMFAHVAGGA